MKHSNTILRIDRPCSQNWQNMTAVDSGKFCSHCSKTVTDFTPMSDEEILKVIRQRNGKLCGRLNTSQLNRLMISREEQVKHTGARKFLAGLLLLSTAGSFSYAQQTLVPPVSQTVNPPTIAENELTASPGITEPTNMIRGKIIGAYKEELVGAVILLKNEKIGTSTDLDGNFSLSIPDSMIKESFNIQVRYVGYYTNEFTVHKRQLPLFKEIILKEDENSQIVGELIIIKKKKWWNRKRKENK